MFKLKNTGVVLLMLCLALGGITLYSPISFGQDIATKGAIGGKVLDSTGAVVPNATVTVSGPTGERTTTTNSFGDFEVGNLIPGSYGVKAELRGFKTVSVSNVAVSVGKTAAVRLTLEVGEITQTVEVTATQSAAVDLTSTAVGASLADTVYQTLPLQRSVTSLFALAPGTTDSLADSSLGGRGANPSISGGSALDNLYVADGVNITDSAFGGLGVFSRSYGTLGVGINTAFIKETQVKTGGFEPQYGQSQGGIVNIITKSGSNDFHGAVYGFARPDGFEATRRQRDDTSVNKVGKILAEESYDAGVDFSGPAVKDRLFFFGSYNPTIRRDIVRGAEASGLRRLFGDETHRRYRTQNYAVKVDVNAAKAHQLNFSVFGDPTETNVAPFRTLNIDNTTATSRLKYGTRNAALRYNGSLTSTWTVTGSASQGKNRFDESGFADFINIVDRTQPTRGNFTAVGLGFFEPTKGYTYRGNFDTSKFATFAGTHTFGFGYQYQRGLYNGSRDRSGPKFTVPATNADGSLRIAPTAAGQTMNAALSLRTAPGSCSLCPFMDIPGVGNTRVFLRQDRGEFGSPSFDTRSNHHAVYAQDTWRVNRYLTGTVGWRWEQERLIGAPGPETGKRLAYSFTGNWSPRIGVTVDPLGQGKMKAYYNFGRFHEYIPLDLAERSLSAEKDFTGGRYAPDFTVDGLGVRRVRLNQFATVIPILDSAHLLSRAAGGFPTSGATISAQDPTNPILPGTKLGYAQEHVFGWEHQLPRGLVLSVRYLDRRLKRIVEDAAVVPPEGADFFGQTYFIGNISAKLDAAVNPIGVKFNPTGAVPRECDPSLVNREVTDSAENVVGAICYQALGKNGKPAGDSGADGVPDGFPDPIHEYQAVEIEVNKRFSENWQLLSNWRIARLRGNFEGHFRNDNGQTDPAISSLFDFTAGEFNLLGDQFKAGPLNTDRRHVINIYGSYEFGGNGMGAGLKGLNLGTGLHMESGVPISEFLAHPVYLNAGEVPSGGRGKLGRTGFYSKLDFRVSYPFQISERTKLSIIGDFFNVTNNRKIRLPNQNRQLTVGQNNVDFGKPVSFYLPFNMRVGLRLDF